MTIIETFLTHENLENASGMKRYMKNHFEFLGIKTPERRVLSKDFLREKPRKGVLTGPLWISCGPKTIANFNIWLEII